MHLFLAACRFEVPLLQVLRQVTPFLLLLCLVVLITYVPALLIGVHAAG